MFKVCSRVEAVASELLDGVGGCVLSLAPEVVCERCESRKIAAAAGAAVISVKTINALAALHPTRAYSAKKLPRPLTGLVELVQNRLPWLP